MNIDISPMPGEASKPIPLRDRKKQMRVAVEGCSICINFTDENSKLHAVKEFIAAACNLIPPGYDNEEDALNQIYEKLDKIM